MAQKLSPAARRAKAARDKAYAMTPDRRKKKADAQKKRRAAPNKAKGKAKATPKPVIPAVSCMAPPSEVSEPAKRDPKIGPVQENDTMARVSAIKKIPATPFRLALSSVEFPQLEGKVNS